MLNDDDGGLFADPRQVRAETIADDPHTVPDWQITNLRKALDDLGLESMAERRALVVELAGRPLASLRELTLPEARQVAEQLAARRQQNTPVQSRSAWDDRDGDTWIDRL